MSNAARKQNDTMNDPRQVLSGIKGYRAADAQKFHERSSSTNLPRPRISPRFIHGWRLPVFFGCCVFTIASVFVAMILLFSRPQKTLSADRTAKAQMTPRIVLIEKEPSVETVVLLVPKKDILPGQKLSSDDFMLTVRPKDLVPQGSISKFEQIVSLESTALLVKDTPITQQMVMNPKLSNPIISSIEPGYRAVTILVNATSAVEGWATAGAYVDVHWVTNSFGDYTVNLLAQNAKILSAERQAEASQPGSSNQQQAAAVIPTTVTLLLTDRDAQKISLASTGGELKLHLRGTEDANKASQATVLTMNDLLGGADDSKMPRGVIKIRDEKGHLQEFSLKNGQIVSRKIA